MATRPSTPSKQAEDAIYDAIRCLAVTVESTKSAEVAQMCGGAARDLAEALAWLSHPNQPHG